MSLPNITVLLPAYDEEGNIGKLIPRINKTLVENKLSYNILVVDDGSTDKTGEILEKLSTEFPLSIARHARNRGLGTALKTGFNEILSKKSSTDVIVVMDSDNTHDPNSIIEMLKGIWGGNDVVIASRYKSGSRVSGVPKIRRLASKVLSLIMKRLFPVNNVYDYTSGYRAYTIKSIEKLKEFKGEKFLMSTGFVVMVELLINLSEIGCAFSEAPIKLEYGEKKGKSKIKFFSTVLEYLKFINSRRKSI